MIACLFSGGKDSTLALHKVVESGRKVDLLISMVSKNDYSYMFHKPNVMLTEMQAQAMGIRHEFFKTEGEKEAELADLEAAIAGSKATAVITGATASEYQKKRIESICVEHGIEHIAPLWHIDPLEELTEISERFDAVVTRVAAEGLDDTFLGKRIDKSMIMRLQALHDKYGINMTFEGGEAESFVLDAPLFKKKIEIGKAHIEHGTGEGTYVIDDAKLVDK